MSAPANAARRVLLAHSERLGRENLARDLAQAGYEVRATASYDCLWRWVRDGAGDLVIIDVDIADPARNGFELLRQIRQRPAPLPALVLSAENTVLTSLLAARFGAFDYFPKPYSFAQLAAAIAGALHRADAHEPPQGAPASLPLVGASAPMQVAYRLIAQAARSSLPVLLSGETGTGKSRVAKVIHEYGERAGAGFAALHFPLAGGDFAAAWKTALGKAGGGTLVLEDINAMDAREQTLTLAAIARLEQARHSPRLMATMGPDVPGGDALAPVRHDLLYRLNTLHIALPPLRQRDDDVEALACAFARKFSQGGKSLAPAALRALAGRPWPGNVRELSNLVQRAVLVTPGDVLEADDLLDIPAEAKAVPEPGNRLEQALARALATWLDGFDPAHLPGDLHAEALAALERPLLEQVMALSAGNQLQGARSLGINRNTLRKKLVRHGLLGK